MAGLMHPQKRAASAMLAMVENRVPGIAQADDWLARGWNPFLRQEDGWRSPAAIEAMMGADWRWGDWIVENATALAPLAAKLPRNARGKIDAGRALGLAASRCWSESQSGPLDALLSMGADPNRGPGSWSEDAPPMFMATRAGAERLAAAGWDPRQKGHKGESCWEHWALRVAHGRGQRGMELEDLDWLAKICPPSWSGSHPVGAMALSAGNAGIARRLADAGAPASAFGVREPGDLSAAILMALGGADRPELLSALGDAVGWDAMASALSGDGGADSPLRLAAYQGRVKSLGVMLARCPALFEPAALAKLAVECAGDWAEPSKSLSRRSMGGMQFMRPSPAGMVWIVGRLPASQAEAAGQALALCVEGDAAGSSKVALACASKGLLAASGPHSVTELYQGGDAWEGTQESGSGQEFSEFAALCEARIMKRAFKPKKAAVSAKRRL